VGRVVETGRIPEAPGAVEAEFTSDPLPLREGRGLAIQGDLDAPPGGLAHRAVLPSVCVKQEPRPVSGKEGGFFNEPTFERRPGREGKAGHMIGGK